MPPPTAAPCRAETARGAEPPAGYGTGGALFPAARAAGRRSFPQSSGRGAPPVPLSRFPFCPRLRAAEGNPAFRPVRQGRASPPGARQDPPVIAAGGRGFGDRRRRTPDFHGRRRTSTGQYPAHGRSRTEARTMSPSLSYSYSTTLAHEVRNSRSSGLRFTSWDAATMGIHFCTY